MAKTNGKRNRAVGHQWERDIAKILRDLGYEYVVTSRSESKRRDDQKVDLMNRDEWKNGRFILNIQAKNTASHLPYAKLLGEMPDEFINVIFQNFTEKQGTKFVTTGRYAMLGLDDFLIMFQKAYPQA